MSDGMIRITPITPAIGAEIPNIDVSQAISAGRFRDIYSAFLKHHVIAFRRQVLTIESFAAFAQVFGELNRNDNTSFGKVVDHDAVEVLDYDADHPPLVTKEMWHTDFTGHQTPTKGALLYCLRAPESGGDTVWVSLCAAYDALSKPMQRYLDGMKAEHSTYKSFGNETRADLWQTPEAKARLERIRSRPPAVHPVVRTHPETGRRALFVNEGYTTRLQDVSRSESDAVLDYLFQHIKTPEFQMRFRWEAGSVVVWDNRVTQHYAVADYSERRTMYRIALKGDQPC
jgi:taurine dioxygenase